MSGQSTMGSSIRPSWRPPIGNDRFLIGHLEDRLLRFERDAAGKVVRLVGVTADGEQPTDRDPG